MTKKGNSTKKQTKGQRRDELERKRDDRVRKNVLRKEKKIKEYLEHDENFASFSNQLESLGFKIKDIPGDGNCLFRALGDQVDGDHTTHARHRRETVKYMQEHSGDFEPFMEDNVSFDKHLEELSKLSTYGGNDSIVAFARNHGVNVVIHQLNEPRWVIHGIDYNKNGQVRELHISYHNGEHYSSMRHIGDNSEEPAWIRHNQNLACAALGAAESRQPADKRKDRNAKDKGKRKDKQNTTITNGETSTSVQQGNDELTAEQLVMAATGCKDFAVVAQTLEENSYNIDASINYILQLMYVAEETGCMSDEIFMSNSEVSKFNINDNTTGDTKECTETMEPNNVSEQVKDNEAKCVNVMSDIHTFSGETSKESSDLRTSHDTETCLESSNPTREVKEFVKDLRESLSEREHDRKNSYNHQGARPKVKSKNSNTQKPGNEHLSNKKRKELAKQDKKQRREEKRKEDLKSCQESSVAEEKSVNEVVADLGVLAI